MSRELAEQLWARAPIRQHGMLDQLKRAGSSALFHTQGLVWVHKCARYQVMTFPRGDAQVLTVASVSEVDSSTDIVDVDDDRFWRSPVHQFAIAATVGYGVVLLPFLWILTDLWTGRPSLLRTVLPGGLLGNFYDLQARAMFHGHLYVANGALGQEAFIHDGHQYTYFGLFPSLIRMPVLAITDRLDGRLTVMSMLVAWLVTGTLLALLLWRVHIILCGSGAVSRTRLFLYGATLAFTMGGSVLLVLAANPWVYSEDIAWSIAFMLGVMFALMGAIERPTLARIALCGIFLIGANITRGSAGYGCVIGGLCASVILYLRSRRVHDGRKWWPHMLVVSLAALALSMAVSWLKFGVVDGYPLTDQIYYNTHHLGLINHGHYFSIGYLPSGIYNYLLSPGIHIGSLFPYITLPQYPAHSIGKIQLFGSEEVTSIPGSMALLFILSCWGIIALVVRRKEPGTRAMYPPLVVGAAPAAAVLCFGFIDNRFVGDFFPVIALATCIGLVDVTERMKSWGRSVRKSVVAVVVALGVFGIAANVGISVAPTGWWVQTQVINFVQTQESAGHLTGAPLSSVVKRVPRLPSVAPFISLYEVGNCQALYVRPSTGFLPWLAVGEPSRQHALCTALLG